MSTEDFEACIIVPVYNDHSGLKTTIDSLRNLTTSYSYEILIVDNGSTDQTPEVGRSHQEELTNSHFHRETEVQSSYAARNTGIIHSNTDLLAFLDADMIVPEDWLESAIGTFQSTDADYMGCNVELNLPDSPTLASFYDHHTGFPVKQYIQHQHFAPTCCLLVRRSVFEDVGLFDPRLISGGDKEFGNRVHNAGYEMDFAADVTVNHPTRNTIRDLVTKDIRVGRGHCQLQRNYPDRYGSPGLPPRPSGVKSPSRELTTSDRLTFGAMSTVLTGVRGIGYYRELLAGDRHPGIDGPPQLR